MRGPGPAAALVATMALAGAIPAALAGEGQTRQVIIPGKAFAPSTLQVLPGDTVVWSNNDSTNHTVTSNEGSFDSGYLSSGTTFALTFSKLGHFAYHCSIHKFMKGDVVVVPVSLKPPAGPVVAGGRVVLQGLAPTGTTRVSVERLGADSHVERRVVPAGDGSFTVTLRAAKPEFVVARVKGLSSTPVRIAVAPHVHVRVAGGTATVTAKPGRPGARAVVQRYVREKFAWRDVARGRLDGASHVSLALPRGHSGRFRIVVRGGRGWADGVSGNIVRHG
jgi:plastocyanin